MRLAIEPVGERKLVANSELWEGPSPILLNALVDFIDDLGYVDLLDKDDDADELAAYNDAVWECDLPALVQWFNGQADPEWEARILED